MHQVSIMRIVHIDDGGDGMRLVQSTLPSLHTVAPTYASYRMIENDFLDIGVDEEGIKEDEDGVKLDDVRWVISPCSEVGGVIDNKKVPKAKLLDAFVSATGYFGNESGQGHIYAQCAILINIPETDSDERIAVTKAAYDAAFGSALFEDIFINTRAGMSAVMEEQAAENRYEQYSRKNPTHGLKKPKMQQSRRASYDYDDDDDDSENDFGDDPRLIMDKILHRMFGF